MTVMTWKYFETRQALWKFFMYSLKLSRNDKPRFVHSFFLGSVTASSSTLTTLVTLTRRTKFFHSLPSTMDS